MGSVPFRKTPLIYPVSSRKCARILGHWYLMVLVCIVCCCNTELNINRTCYCYLGCFYIPASKHVLTLYYVLNQASDVCNEGWSLDQTLVYKSWRRAVWKWSVCKRMVFLKSFQLWSGTSQTHWRCKQNRGPL